MRDCGQFKVAEPRPQDRAARANVMGLIAAVRYAVEAVAGLFLRQRRARAEAARLAETQRAEAARGVDP